MPSSPPVSLPSASPSWENGKRRRWSGAESRRERFSLRRKPPLSLKAKSPMLSLLCKPKHPPEPINQAEPSRRRQQAGALVLADCVTSLGAMPVEMDSVGIDIAYSCAQKGLSCPAGLSPISLSPRAWEWLEKRPDNPASWYFDLRLLAQLFRRTPYLSPHTVAAALLRLASRLGRHSGGRLARALGKAQECGAEPNGGARESRVSNPW